MTEKRCLIVNADDFGQSPGINRGIIEAHEHGVVTSASLMVRWPAAIEAAAYSHQRPKLSLGLHLDLGEWTFRGGEWVALYNVIPTNDVGKISHELDRQVGVFRRLTGRNPTHIDSHQHVHMEEPVRSIVMEIARRLDLPLRNCCPDIQYNGGFYGQTAEGLPNPNGISVNALIQMINELPPGATELSCHPAKRADIDTMYRDERDQEVNVLCDPRIGLAINDLGIDLVSFGNYRRCIEMVVTT